MLVILFIYFIGKRFYDLSEEYNQNKWLFAILGVLIYYIIGSLLLAGIVLLDVLVFDWGFDWESGFGMNLLMVPLGLIAVWAFYVFLEGRWKKTVIVAKDEINDIGRHID
ncbi:hypothetical protein [uncultured Algibacter sp.]|uniref:hypothetical protein n=1 Tax=uncultured Algibacter sp. TaxID=298659 RepID=UPI003216D4CA